MAKSDGEGVSDLRQIDISSDAVEQVRPGILRLCILLVIGTTLCALVVMPFVVPRASLAAYLFGFGPFLFAYALSYWLLSTGRHAWAAGIFLGGTILGQIGATFTASGVEAQSLISFVNLIVIAGFTIGGRAALMTGVLCVTVIALHMFLDSAQMLPTTRFTPSAGGQAVALITTLLANTGLIFIGLQHFGRALVSERQATLALGEAYDELAVAEKESVVRAGLAERLVGIGELIVGAREPQELMNRVCLELCALPALSHVWVADGAGEAVGGEAPTDPLPEAVVGAWQTDLNRANTLSVGQWSGHAPADERQHGYWVRLKVDPLERFLCVTVVKGAELGRPVQIFLETAGSLVAAGISRLLAEAQLLRSQKMEMVNQFSAGIAHDLNNLLMAITTGTELVALRVGEADAEVVEHLTTVKTAADASAKLIEKLMSFARSNPTNRETVEACALVTRMEPLFRRLVGEGVELTVDVPEKPVWVSAAPVALEQIGLNLVTNAGDAVGVSGRVSISLTSHAPEGTVALTVSDDGRGMTPEVRARIFEAFYTTRRNEGGTGLGLTTVYALVKACGGRVEVQSEAGRGSQFTVYLPQSMEALADEQQTSSSADLSAMPGQRVLLVEDDEGVRRTLRAVLEGAGHHVDEAQDGAEALTMVRRAPEGPGYTVIVSDVVMPRLGGMELFRRLRDEGPRLPFVLMTGYAPPEDTPTAEDDVRLLAKPFSNGRLLMAMREAIFGSARVTDSAPAGAEKRSQEDITPHHGAS